MIDPEEWDPFGGPMEPDVLDDDYEDNWFGDDDW